MDIVKQNETFLLTDSTEAFTMNGSVTYEVSGGLNIQFNLINLEGEYIVNCSYYKYVDNDKANFNISAPEERRAEFTAYADTVIASVFEFLK